MLPIKWALVGTSLQSSTLILSVCSVRRFGAVINLHTFHNLIANGDFRECVMKLRSPPGERPAPLTWDLALVAVRGWSRQTVNYSCQSISGFEVLFGCPTPYVYLCIIRALAHDAHCFSQAVLQYLIRVLLRVLLTFELSLKAQFLLTRLF